MGAATTNSLSEKHNPEVPSCLVLVLIESHSGQVEKVSFELLSDARKVAAGLKGRVEVVLLMAPDHSAKAQ
jgi:hypothetical protein